MTIIDINAKQDTATALCFHPHKNIINIASGNEIFVCDLASKHVIGKVSIDSEPAAIITHLYQPISHNYLVAATDVGSVYVWEMNRRTLVSEHHDVEKKPLACIAGSSLLPTVFFSRVSSRDVSGIDLRPGNISNAYLKFKGSKKNVLSIACHPTKHMMATTGQDGVVRVWDSQTQSLVNTLDDLVTYEGNRGVGASEKYMVAFEPRDAQAPHARLVCVSANGVLVGWSDVSSDQPKIAFSCQLKIKSKIVNIAFHPTLPILITLLANGSICGWEPWQSEFLPSGYLTEFSLIPHESNKFSHLPSYAQRPPLSGAPTQLFLHPSAKYFTFLWDTTTPIATGALNTSPSLTQSHSAGSLPTINNPTLHSSPSVPNLKNSPSLNNLASPTRTAPSLSSSPARPNPLSVSASAIPRPILSSPSSSASNLLSSSPVTSPLRSGLSSSAPLKLTHTASSANIILPSSPSPASSAQNASPMVANASAINAGANAMNAGNAASGATGSSGGVGASTNANILQGVQITKRLTVRQLIYTHTDTIQPLTTLPLVSLLQPQLGFFYDEKQSFSYPKDAVYFDNNAAISYYFIKGESVKLIDLPPPKGDTARDLVRPIRFVYSPKQQGYIVFYEISRFNSGGENYKCLISLPNLGFTNQYEIAQDGVFAGHDDGTMMLLVGGTHLHVSAVAFMEWKEIKLDTVVSRMFKTPFGSGNVVLYFDKKEQRLIYSHPETYLPDPSKGYLSLLDDESVIQVVWQGTLLAAVLTTSRLLIMNSKFEIVAQVEESQSNYPMITSIMWLEWVLLYTTETHLKYFTLEGKVFTLRALDRDKVVLSALLPDRVLYGGRNVTNIPDLEAPPPTTSLLGFGLGAWATPPPNTNNGSVGLGGSTTFHQHAVGLLEPLLMGLFAPPVNAPVENIKDKISFIISRFDTGRVTKRVLDKLIECGHPDAAFQLTEKSTRYAPDYRYTLAFNAKFYDKALAIASAEYEKTRDARNRARVLAVGQACAEDQKYVLASKAFELANDSFALLNLYVTSNHKAGLELLRNTAEEQGDKFTIVLIDRILSKPMIQNRNAMVDSPAAPALYSPTHFINVSMRMGGEFLSPLNLNSLSRWLTTANAATISAASQLQLSISTSAGRLVRGNSSVLPVAPSLPQAPSLAPPPITEKVENPRGNPPKRFGSLRTNQQALSTKTTLSSSSTLRRSPSFERVVSLPVLPKRPLEDLLVDDEEDYPNFTRNLNGKLALTTSTPTPTCALLTSTATPSSIPPTSTPTMTNPVSTIVSPNTNDEPTLVKEANLQAADKIKKGLKKGASKKLPRFPSIYLPRRPSQEFTEDITQPAQELINEFSTHLTKQFSIEFTREPSRDLNLSQPTPELIATPSKELSIETVPEPINELPKELVVDSTAEPEPEAEPEATKELDVADSSPEPETREDLGRYDTLRGDNRYYTINTLSASFTPSYFSSFPTPLPLSHFAQAATSPLGNDPDTHIKYKEATERMQYAMLLLEEGSYDESLEDVSKASQVLTAISNPKLIRKELRLCVAYTLALRLLMKIKEMDKSAGEEKAIAFTSTYLTLPLMPKHRVVVLRQAINKNLAIGNYGTAAKMLKILISLDLPDRAASVDKWRTCRANKLSDTFVFPPFTHLCFMTFTPLSPPTTICNLCSSTFSPTCASLGSACPYCSNGTLKEK